MILQGTAAQNSGRDGEQLIEDYFLSINIKVLKNSDFNKLSLSDKFVAVRGYPYQNHLNTNSKIDFALLRWGVPILGIEVKTQEVPGSVDEKIAAVALNGKKSIFQNHICAIIGKHWTYGRGEQWVKTINEEYKRTKFSVLNATETFRKIDVCINSDMNSKADKTKLGYVGKKPGAARDSDSWYTPSKYVESARTVLGGFELDPFSSLIANKTIKATKFFTIEDDGLAQSWNLSNQKSVWMNPPYGKTMSLAVDKFVAEYEKGNFESGIVLCNNATDTKWFAKLSSKAAAFCFTNHRIQFENFDGKASSVNTRGQVFAYFGSDINLFKSEFAQYGHIMVMV